MIGDGQWIAVLTIDEQELAFVIGTPQFIGTLANGESGSLGPTTHTAAALDQAMAIQHRMDGALGRDRNSRESAQEALANLAGTPAWVLALHVQDEVFHLEGKLIRIAVGSSASVRQPLPSNATAGLLSIEATSSLCMRRVIILAIMEHCAVFASYLTW